MKEQLLANEKRLHHRRIHKRWPVGSSSDGSRIRLPIRHEFVFGFVMNSSSDSSRIRRRVSVYTKTNCVTRSWSVRRNPTIACPPDTLPQMSKPQNENCKHLLINSL